jgi:hypothetical protein
MRHASRVSFASSRIALLFSLGLTLVVGSGCAYRTHEAHIPSSIAPSPGAPVVLEVERIEVDDPEGSSRSRSLHGADASTEAAIRAEAIEILKAAEPRNSSGAPAHVRAHVTLGESGGIDDAIHKDGLAVVGYLYAPFGVVIDRQALRVDVTVESNGRTFAGHGEASLFGSIYAHARRRALALALDRALAASRLASF